MLGAIFLERFRSLIKTILARSHRGHWDRQLAKQGVVGPHYGPEMRPN